MRHPVWMPLIEPVNRDLLRLESYAIFDSFPDIASWTLVDVCTSVSGVAIPSVAAN